MGSGAQAQQLVNSVSAGLIAGIRTILGSASMVVLVMTRLPVVLAMTPSPAERVLIRQYLLETMPTSP